VVPDQRSQTAHLKVQNNEIEASKQNTQRYDPNPVIKFGLVLAKILLSLGQQIGDS
jgi:hypothetical protein